MFKKYYREIEEGYGHGNHNNNTEYHVIEVNDEDVVTEHYVNDMVRVDKEDVLNLEKYIIENAHDAMITDIVIKETYIADVNDLPIWFVKIIYMYDNDPDYYNENEKEKITEEQVNELLRTFHEYNIEEFASQKVVYIWDGSNHKRFVLEDDVNDTEFNEDDEGMFDDYIISDSEDYNTGYRAIVENETGKYLQNISNYQSDIGVSYESINRNIDTLEEYDKSVGRY